MNRFEHIVVLNAPCKRWIQNWLAALVLLLCAVVPTSLKFHRPAWL